MIKVRFESNSVEDYRPIIWPIKYPYWCTGTLGDGSKVILVAYVESLDELYKQWPEAEKIDVFQHNVTECEFSDRMPKPDWYQA
jgi:hypothetical protein